MAAISLGVRYLQVSQQLQRTNRALEATDSSLRQQLLLRSTQLGQREQELQGARRELAQTREALQVEQRDCQAVKEQSQAWLTSWEETKEALKSQQTQRREVEERLNRLREKLRPLCLPEMPEMPHPPLQHHHHHHSSEACCPLGWIPMATNCFYVSLIKRSWEGSQSYCKSLSSNLAVVTGFYSDFKSSSVYKVLEQVDSSDSYWIEYRWKDRDGIDDKRVSEYSIQKKRCVSLPIKWTRYSYPTDCGTSLPFVCEMASIRRPDYH